MKTMYIRYDGWTPSVLGDAVSGQVNTMRCSFAFSTDWDAYKNRKAIFETDDAKKEESLDENGVCLIPRAVLMKRGKLKISAYGTETGENGELLRYNGRPAEIIVDLGGNVDGEITDDPVYPQIGEAVLYTAQTLTDAQKAQARANIGAGTPYTLPEASPDALGGVKADAVEAADTQPVRIGEDGKLYTAPGGSGEAVLYTAQSLTEEQQEQARNNIGVRIPFVVTISKDSDGNITADKTFSEIKAAHDAGMTIYASYKSTMYSLVGYSSDGIASFALNERYNHIGFTCESSGVEDFWSYYEEDLISLDIYGASAGQVVKVKSVDENGVPTQWEAGDVSSGGADISLGISGASAGQVAKVKTVDASGTPTAWEAGDAASGGGASEWTLFQEGITDADVSGFEFDGVGDYTEFLFLGSWVKGSGKAGLSVKMNDAFALTVGNYFVHDGQAKNVSVELILMERKRFSLRALSQQQNSTQYNIDALGAQSIYNIPQGIETPITKISFYSSTTSVQIPAGATYALYVR